MKLYPHISDRICVVGYLQNIQKIDGFDPQKLTGVPQSHIPLMPHHFVLTDDKLRISNVSEKFAKEIGLNSKFFMNSQNIFMQSIKLSQLLGPEISEPDFLKEMEATGIEMHIDTRNILELVNLEYLNEEEIIEARSRIGIYSVHVQVKTLVFDPEFCTLKIFRFIFLPNTVDTNRTDSGKDIISIN